MHVIHAANGRTVVARSFERDLEDPGKMTLKKEAKRSSKRMGKSSHKASNCGDDNASVLQQESSAKECEQTKPEAGAQSAGY